MYTEDVIIKFICLGHQLVFILKLNEGAQQPKPFSQFVSMDFYCRWGSCTRSNHGMEKLLFLEKLRSVSALNGSVCGGGSVIQ